MSHVSGMDHDEYLASVRQSARLEYWAKRDEMAPVAIRCASPLHHRQNTPAPKVIERNTLFPLWGKVVFFLAGFVIGQVLFRVIMN